MKKLKVILILLSIIASAVKAQNKDVDWPAYGAKNFRHTALSLGPGLGLFISIDTNSKWIEYQNRHPNLPLTNNYVFLKGTKKITVYGYLPKDSANLYRYNIIENDNKLLATNARPVVKKARDYEHSEITLGEFDVENKKLTIEVYKITSPLRVKSTTIYNKEIERAKISTITRGVGSGIMAENLQNGFKFKINDELTVSSLYVVINPSDLLFLYNVYLKNLNTGKKDLVSNNWLHDHIVAGDKDAWTALPYMIINASFFNEPGDYELQIVPELPGGHRIKSFPESTTTFRFTILPSAVPLQAKTVIKFIAIGLGVIACIAFIAFYLIRIRNKKLLAEQKQQKDMAQLQLEAVRSQLNPHFLFNALAGIQNLMNKTDIDQANRYLTKFARLTRNVLNNKDLINLSEEKTLLDDYLQMEQMRFGFSYEILIDDNIDISNLQIPSMLLHPFVENAVKHGLPNDERTGKITISISKKDNDLELAIADNGKGFNKQNDGIGLQLSKKRIALLNTIYKDSPINLDVRSGTGGTVVKITLTHWL